ncbi:hypothetical protein ACFLXG_00905 [Chloroflexota bacterium]
MSQITNKEKLFKAYLDRIQIELNFTYMHFVVLKTIDDVAERYQPELQVGSEFWGLARQSQFFDVMIRLNKICDNHPNAVSIFSLLEFAEMNLDIFSEDNFMRRNPYSSYDDLTRISKKLLESHKKKYENFPQSNLKRLRNKVLAHMDKETVEQNHYPFEKWAVEIQEMEHLINNLVKTINLLAMAFERSRFLPGNNFVEKGMFDTMELIRLGLSERKEN